MICVVLFIHTIRICAEIFDNRVPNYIRKGRVARREYFKAGHLLSTRNGNPGRGTGRNPFPWGIFLSIRKGNPGRGTGRNHFPWGIFLSIRKGNPGGGKNVVSLLKRVIFSPQETETLSPNL